MSLDPRARPATTRNHLGACEFHLGAQGGACERQDCRKTWAEHYPKTIPARRAYEPGTRRY